MLKASYVLEECCCLLEQAARLYLTLWLSKSLEGAGCFPIAGGNSVLGFVRAGESGSYWKTALWVFDTGFLCLALAIWNDYKNSSASFLIGLLFVFCPLLNLGVLSW